MTLSAVNPSPPGRWLARVPDHPAASRRRAASGQAGGLRRLDLGGKDGWQLHLVLKRQRIDNCFAQPLRHPVGVGVWDEFVGRASLGPLT
jgi:hypothetical protein